MMGYVGMDMNDMKRSSLYHNSAMSEQEIKLFKRYGNIAPQIKKLKKRHKAERQNKRKARRK